MNRRTQRAKGLAGLAGLILCLGAVPVAAQSDAPDDDELGKCRETNRTLRAEVANLRAELAATKKRLEPVPSDENAKAWLDHGRRMEQISLEFALLEAYNACLEDERLKASRKKFLGLRIKDFDSVSVSIWMKRKCAKAVVP